MGDYISFNLKNYLMSIKECASIIEATKDFSEKVITTEELAWYQARSTHTAVRSNVLYW
jgi:hypothetical protein